MINNHFTVDHSKNSEGQLPETPETKDSKQVDHLQSDGDQKIVEKNLKENIPTIPVEGKFENIPKGQILSKRTKNLEGSKEAVKETAEETKNVIRMKSPFSDQKEGDLNKVSEDSAVSTSGEKGKMQTNGWIDENEGTKIHKRSRSNSQSSLSGANPNKENPNPLMRSNSEGSLSTIGKNGEDSVIERKPLLAEVRSTPVQTSIENILNEIKGGPDDPKVPAQQKLREILKAITDKCGDRIVPKSLKVDFSMKGDPRTEVEMYHSDGVLLCKIMGEFKVNFKGKDGKEHEFAFSRYCYTDSTQPERAQKAVLAYGLCMSGAALKSAGIDHPDGIFKADDKMNEEFFNKQAFYVNIDNHNDVVGNASNLKTGTPLPIDPSKFDTLFKAKEKESLRSGERKIGASTLLVSYPTDPEELLKTKWDTSEYFSKHGLDERSKKNFRIPIEDKSGAKRCFRRAQTNRHQRKATQ